MYAVVKNGKLEKFPYSIAQLKADNPNTSFPVVLSKETLAAFDVVAVRVQDPPAYDRRTQVIDRASSPVLLDGEWWITQTATAKPQEQIDAEREQAIVDIKADRDNALVASDWTQVADAPVDKAAWAAYRQALRDLPQQPGFPDTVVWPEQP